MHELIQSFFSLKNALCIFIFMLGSLLSSHAQNEIKGTVTNIDNEPLAGVTILASNTNSGTISNLEGEFSLTVPEGVPTLTFSYIGMKTKQVPIGKRKNINVILEPENNSIDEVVLIGFGTKAKSNLVTAITKVNADEVIADRPVPSITNALQGLVPGVNVTSDRGIPGEGFEIDIRGQSSVNYAGVHVVLDGIPSDMDALYNLNPNDIESISVLKDAASTAIYGSRGAGGVILITTKKPKGTGITVEYSGLLSMQSPTREPDFLSPYEHALAHNIAFENAGRNPRFTSEQLAAIQDPNVDAIVSESGNEWFFSSNTNWFDLMFDQAFQQTHNVAVNGGGKNTRYRFSLGYLDQNGFFSEYGPDNYDRINGILNLDSQLSDEIDLNVRLNYTRGHNQTAMLFPDRAVYENGGFLPVYDPNGEFARYDNRSYNPIQVMQEAGFRESKDDEIQIDGVVSWNPTANFTLEATGRYSYTIDRYTGFARSFGYYGPNGLIDFSHRGRENSVDEYMQYFHNKQGQVLANYDLQIGSKHDLNFTGVFSAEDDSRRQVRVGVENIIGNEVPSFLLGDQNSARIRGAMQHGASVSLIGRVSYNYDNRYLLEGSIGHEGSYRFAPETRWATFPAISGGWRISEEKFMENVDFVNQLKVRVSYGEVGNSSGIGRFDYLPTYSLTTPYVFAGGSGQGIVTNGITTRSKEWERIAMINYGLDISLLDNRLYFTGELYRNYTENMLIEKMLPSIIGNAGDSRRNPVGNYGSYETDGWEISGGWRDNMENGFNYDVSFNLADRKSKITSLDSDLDVEPTYNANRYRDIEGYPVGWNFFGYESAGLFQSQAEVDNWPKQNNNTGPGDIRYVDQNNDGVINNADAVYLGNLDPHYIYGFTLKLGYKNFDLRTIFSGVAKQKFYMDRNAAAPFYRRDGNYSYVAQSDFWTPENANAAFPRPYEGGRHNYEYSDFWMKDGSYFRMNDLILGYNVSESILDRINIKNARITVSGQNLWTVTNVPDYIDPTNGRYNSYPTLSSYTLGLNVTF